MRLGGCSYHNGSAEHFWPDPAYTATNQSAELGAILGAINKGIKEGEVDLIIRTDSDYAIKCLTVWCEKWKQNSWTNARGEPGPASIMFMLYASSEFKTF